MLYPPSSKQTQLHSWGTGATKPVSKGKTLDYDMHSCLQRSQLWRQHISIALSSLKEAGSSLVKKTLLLLHGPLLPQSALNPSPCRCRQCLTLLLPLLSATLLCCRKEEDKHKDFFLLKAASCSATCQKFSLSWHNHPTTGLSYTVPKWHLCGKSLIFSRKYKN